MLSHQQLPMFKNYFTVVRKVLGATTAQLVLLLSKDLVRITTIALCIAGPVSWWIMQDWLSGFAWHIPLGIDIYVITVTALVLMTVLTISFQGSG